MKKIITIICLILSVTACSNTSGLQPNVSFSGFDNAKVVTIAPHGNDSDSIIGTGIGAQWSSASPETVLLKVAVFNDVVRITSAELNIDGEKIVLGPAPGVTDVSYGTIKESTKAFSTNIATIKAITNSKKTWLRVTTLTDSIENAIIDGGEGSKAYHAMRRFLDAIEKDTKI